MRLPWKQLWVILPKNFGEDPEKWRVIGLVHDLDYDQFPDEHCHKCVALFQEHGWPEDYIRAVISHGWGICTDVEPQTRLEKPCMPSTNSPGLLPVPLWYDRPKHPGH